MGMNVFSVSLNRKSGVPAYRQIQEEYRNRILGGLYAEGMVFPSEGAMAKVLRMNKLTLRRAIQALEKEGLVQKARGRPTSVCQRSAWVQSQHRPTVAILIPQGEFEPYKEDLLGHLCRHCVRLGMDVRICRETEPLGIFMDGVQQSRVDGMISFPTTRREYMKQLEKTAAPLLMFEMREDTPARADRVVVDNLTGYRLALASLKALGHTNIMYVGALSKQMAADGKLSFTMLRNTYLNSLFFRRAMEDANLDSSPERCLEMPFHHEGADVLVRNLLEAKELPTALMVFNDELAQILFRALEQHGLSVPGDISVVGGGGFPDANVGLSLATVAADRDEIAKAAALRMQERLKNGGLSGLVVEIATRFIQGASVGIAQSRSRVVR